MISLNKTKLDFVDFNVQCNATYKYMKFFYQKPQKITRYFLNFCEFY